MAWGKLSAAGIRIIRTGLQITSEMEKEGAVITGPVHPAFGSLVLSAICYDRTIKLIEQIPRSVKKISFQLCPQDISTFRGWNNNNIDAIKNLYPSANIDVKVLREQRRGVISVIDDQGNLLNAVIPGIA
jgi:hypothetical protein